MNLFTVALCARSASTRGYELGKRHADWLENRGMKMSEVDHSKIIEKDTLDTK